MNPAAWVLQITALNMESSLNMDFADLYADSKACR